MLNHLPDSVEHLTAWCDSCGGQNRNIKICAMWLHLLAVTRLQTINNKFLESGHSYLLCDSDFGDIEKHARYKQNVYSPDEWYKLVRKSRNKHQFEVIEMDIEIFYSTKGLEKSLTNRKKHENGEKVQWLKIKQFTLKKVHI